MIWYERLRNFMRISIFLASAALLVGCSGETPDPAPTATESDTPPAMSADEREMTDLDCLAAITVRAFAGIFQIRKRPHEPVAHIVALCNHRVHGRRSTFLNRIELYLAVFIGFRSKSIQIKANCDLLRRTATFEFLERAFLPRIRPPNRAGRVRGMPPHGVEAGERRGEPEHPDRR